MEKVTRVDWCVEFVFTHKPYDFKATDGTVTLIVVKSKMSVSQLFWDTFSTL